MPKGISRRLIEIHRVEEIPAGMTEEEEHRFWSTHTLGDELLNLMEPPEEDELPPARVETHAKEHAPVARVGRARKPA